MKRSPLRSDPEKTRDWLRRGRRKSAESLARSRSPLKRKRRLKPVNRERRERLRQEQFGEQSARCRKLPCIACGELPPSVPHHTVSRGAGGRDEDCVPMCGVCHNEGHTVGWAAFEETWDVDLRAEAKRLAGVDGRKVRGEDGWRS